MYMYTISFCCSPSICPPPPPPLHLGPGNNENINVSLYKALILEKPYRASMAVFLWPQNGVRRCLACASGLRRSHDRGWVVAAAIEQKRRKSTYFVERRNRPRRFHVLVEIRRDRPRDQNQSSAPPIIYYNRLTPGEAKETHPITCFWT